MQSSFESKWSKIQLIIQSLSFLNLTSAIIITIVLIQKATQMTFWKTLNALIIFESGIYFLFTLITSICFHRTYTKIMREQRYDILIQIFGRIVMMLMLLGYNFFAWLIITVKIDVENKLVPTEIAKIVYIIMGQLIVVYLVYAILEPYIIERIKLQAPAKLRIPTTPDSSRNVKLIANEPCQHSNIKITEDER
ncbi:uncharacterized protein VTP21DRAFT_7875 [Calcarisporiella thermophila]|uniref:uncharacterized protein n=1 Tax=Calcarisporiella thermophila TaxID=911321 RepID=UPI003743936A